MSLVGVEPTIFRFEAERGIHFATNPPKWNSPIKSLIFPSYHPRLRFVSRFGEKRELFCTLEDICAMSISSPSVVASPLRYLHRSTCQELYNAFIDTLLVSMSFHARDPSYTCVAALIEVINYDDGLRAYRARITAFLSRPCFPGGVIIVL